MFYPNKAVYSILTTAQGALPNRGHGRKNARVRKQSKIYETTSSSKDTELQMPALGPYKTGLVYSQSLRWEGLMGVIPLPAELLAQVDLGGGSLSSITYTLRIPPGSS